MASQSTLSPRDRAKLRSMVRDTWSAQGKSSWIRLIDTQSMSPSLSGNVFLLVEWTASANFSLGELILFSSQRLELPIVHRVCRLEITKDKSEILQVADQLTTNEVGIGWISKEAILGRVVAIRWGNQGSRVIQLSSWPYSFLGALLATLSAKWWEYTNETSHSKLIVVRWLVVVLHRILSTVYALCLRSGVVAFLENSPPP